MRLPGWVRDARMGNFNPVERDEIEETKLKLVEHQLVTLTTLEAFQTLVALLIITAY